MSEIKSICVVGGLGKMGGFHVKRLREEHPNIEVKIIDYSSLITDQYESDAFIVATPTPTHYDITRNLLKQGKNVLVEKPMTLSFNRATKLIATAAQSNCTLMVSHTMEYYPQYLSELNRLKISREPIAFVMRLPHKNILENLVFDIMIHQIAIIGQIHDDYIRPENFKLTNKDEVLTCEIDTGHRKYSIEAMYNSKEDERYILLGEDKVVDYKRQLEVNEPDSLETLHNTFIDSCLEHETPVSTYRAAWAVDVAQYLQYQAQQLGLIKVIEPVETTSLLNSTDFLL